MNDEALLNLSNRMKNDFYVGVVGSVRSGKSSFINSFFKAMIIPNINDEFVKNKLTDELPQSAAGRQIMTVEPKFIPSSAIELNIGDIVTNLRFVDCVGEIIPKSEGYGSDEEPRLVKTPWFDEAIPFKEAASIGTEKVIYNHSNLGIYVTSDGSFGDFSRNDYEQIENNLIPKMKDLNKPFVIILNTKNPKNKESIKLAKDIEAKWNISCIPVSSINLTKEDCSYILSKALEEFPISDLEISLPDYINVIGDDMEIKNEILSLISNAEHKYNKVKEINYLCNELRDSNLFSNVTLELLDASSGKASIVLDLDDSKYTEIVNTLLGDKCHNKADFIEFLYTSRKANEVYSQINTAILEAKETGYGLSIPRIEDMQMLSPEVVKKNGMYGVKMSAKAKVIHMIAVDLEASFTPIIGSYDQATMLMESMKTEENDDEAWNKEFFGKKLSDIVCDSMKSKIHNFPDKSKDKIKSVLDKIMNSNRNNLIAIIL
ncbi:MAG: stage IV sporulation protein A [Acholeplasmatales bacterium]|nr:stage IV sporulation protein A [Acholeplasmatales bacterium]